MLNEARGGEDEVATGEVCCTKGLKGLGVLLLILVVGVFATLTTPKAGGWCIRVSTFFCFSW